ncbi:MAG: UvrD-helicase domain-containing protein [Erysipelotrichaceae bacterium]|nr:UvrD-helicase domain-containing protein [Erysipelotrichaceae bacterium]
MKWSVNQQRAIETLGKNVVVSASAGAGKTAVLTARLTKRIVEDHVPVTAILAMTFTEAAAAEMKSRLFMSLSKSAEQETDPQQKQFLLDQLVLLGSAHVSTIHSFCLSVIKENYFMIHLDPKTASNILSDDECLMLKQQAWNQAVDEFYQSDKNRFESLAHYFSGRSDDVDALKNSAMKLAQIYSETEDLNSLIGQFKQNIQPVRTLSELSENLLRLFMDACHAQALCIENALDEALDIINKTHADVSDFESHVRLRKEKLAPLKDALDTMNYREVYRIIRNCCETPLGRVTKEEALKPVRKKIMDLCNDAAAFLISEDQLIQSINDTAPYAETLIDLSLRIHHNYAIAKAQKQAMDFGDMEQFALKILLADNKRTARKIQRQFEDILVDEFQDTNDVQNTIIELISRGNNIFRVGDIKQSIYRFRGARPQIMRDLIHSEDGSQEIIFLSENYRSCKSIVEFNNYLFNVLMNVQGLSQEYTSFDWVSIGTDSQDDHDEYPVEFHAISPSEELNDEEEMGDLKADYIAKEILSMKEKTKFKKWSDYCVLVRSHAVKDKLRYSFDKAGIPNSMAVKSGFYKSVSIQEIIQFFKLIQNPNDDLAMVTVLTSSMFKMDFETLSKIRIDNKNRSYYFCLDASNNDFIRHYQNVCQCYYQEGLFCAYQAMLDINDFYFNQSVQEKTNLDLFCDRLCDFESKHGPSLNKYLSFLKEVENQPTSEAISASSLDDVVRIMTVHQSKGLQFPVVFFWSTFGTRIMDNTEKCMIDNIHGLGMQSVLMPYRIKRPTLQRLALEYRNSIEEFEENIRLLYVATTRPQTKLILVDQVKDTYTTSPVNLALMFAKKGFSDLLLSGMEQFERYHRILPIIVTPQKVNLSKTEKKSDETIIRWEKQVQQTSVITPSSLEVNDIGPLNLSGYRASLRGTQLHELVEHLPAAPWTASQIKAIAPDIYPSDVERLINLGNHPLFLSLQHNQIHKEYSFILRENGNITHGFIDYLSVSDDTVTLIDFKSDRHVDEQILIERYHDQISAYQHALSKMYPNHQILAYIYSFELNQMIEMR